MKSVLAAIWQRRSPVVAAGILAWALPVALTAQGGLLLPPDPNNEADAIVTVTYGSPAGVGNPPENSYFTADIQAAGGSAASPTPPIPPGRYAAWCFDVVTDIRTGGGTFFGGRLYSSGDPLTAFNQYLPNHPNVIWDAVMWKKINYLINHRFSACNGEVPTMWEVQRAIWLMLNQTPPPTPPYPEYRENVVQCIIDAANTNAAAWQLACGDKIAVIYNIDVNWDANAPDVQLIFIEVPVPCASLGDFVWYDNNANGKQDVGELGVPNVTVQLYRCLDNALVATTATDLNGKYLFSNLVPNDYYVKVLAPAGYVFSAANAPGTSADNDSDASAAGVMACTTLVAGENDLSWDAGLYQAASLGDRVWNDINFNGIQDAGEVGVDGVTVELYSCFGDVLKGTTTTAGGGLYLFTVQPGDYYVKFSNLPPGFVFSPSTSGGASDPSDSDANPSSGNTDCTTLVSGENDLTWDAGIYQPARIGNRVWIDTNANGIQDAGEPGVDGVTVELYTCLGNILKGTATTTAGGLYSFTVPAGDYYVRFSNLPSGYIFTSTVAGSASDPTDSDANVLTGKTDCTTLVPGEYDDTWDAGLVKITPVTLACAGGTGTVGTPYASALVASGGTAPYTYSISAGTLPPGLTLVPATGAITGTPTTAGAFAFTAKVVDSTGGTAQTMTSNCSITVGNLPCVASTFTFSGNTALYGTAGNIRQFTVNGISVRASAFSRTKATAGSTWAPAYLGAYDGGLGVTDASEGDGSGNNHTVDNIGRDNFVLFEFSQPVVVNRAFLGYVVGDSDLTAWVGNAPNAYINHITLTTAFLSGLVQEENLTDSAAVRWAGLNAGEISGNILVLAGSLSDATPNDEFKIAALDICQPTPVVTLACVSNGTGTVAAAYSSALVATGGTPGYTFSITTGALPAGLTLNATTGAITGIPTAAGTFSFTAKVVDSTGTAGTHTASATCTVTIGAPACVQGTFLFAGNTATYGTAGNIRQFTVNGVSVKASAFSRTKPSAGGAWAPAYLGAYDGGLGVTDTSEGDGSGNSHTVDNIGRDNFVLFEFSQPVVVNRAALGYVVNDSDLTAWVGNAANPYINHVTLTTAFLSGLVQEENLVDHGSVRWADLNAGGIVGNILVIAGSLSDTSPDDEFKITALDICQPPAQVTLACVANGTGTVATSYSSSLVAAGGTPGYIYSITAGALPAGLTLNAATGAITGTPTAAGSFGFTAKVVDSTGSTGVHTATQSCSIVVAPPPAPVTLACVANGIGMVAVPYSSALVAAGGTPGYTFSIITGSLPAGLSLNTTTGAVTGTPTMAGTFAFTAKVVDSTGATGVHTASQSCSIAIAPVPVPPVTLACVAVGTGKVGSAYSSALNASGGVPAYSYSITSGVLPAGLTLNAASGAITGTPTTAGAFAFTAKVVDSTGTTGVHTATVNCSITIGAPACVQSTFTFSGTSALSGAAGNIRHFTVNGVSVRASAFSRTKSTSGVWSPAYLGAYDGGLGVTDTGEGDGSGNSHTVDNINRDNFVLFEFSQPVVVNRAFLGYVVNDSDLTAWVGNAANPYVNHVTLSDAVLTGLAREENASDNGLTRWADLNSGQVSGNVLVIAGSLTDTSPDDEFKIAALDICAVQLPSPWLAQDVGSVAVAGNASYTGGTFTLGGSGNDIGGFDGLDEFRFAYQQASGDCTIVAQVLSVQNTHSAAAAGIMIRESLNSDARHAGAFATPASGILLKSRAVTGGSTVTKTVAGVSAPQWLKVVRVGNTFTASRSTNGTTWVQIDVPVTITMGTSVYIGLVANSQTDGSVCTVTINNVTATP